MPSSSLSAARSDPVLVAPGRPQPRTLLVVDDEEGPRQSLRVVFKDEFNLLMAANAAEAIAVVQRQPVDVAVVDIRMPGMSGIELLGHLKQADPSLEVVILTAYETLETARQALRLGACDYLTKPFDLATVRAAVARALDRRRVAETFRSSGQRLVEVQRELEDQRLHQEIVRNRGEIYGSVLHDLNGPLTVIAGFVSLITAQMNDLTTLGAEDTQEFKTRLEVVNRHVNSCVEITQRYLGFLRQATSEPQGVSVNQILRDAGALLRVHPSAQANQITVLPLGEDVQVKLHGTDFIQLLLNLAINGLQATATPHAVEIAALLLAGPLDPAQWVDSPTDRVLRSEDFNPRQAFVAVSIRDTGPGMPPDVVEKLFRTPFTTKPAPHGTGLGLSIVKRLTLLSRSALTLHTEPGAGASFTLYLPLVPA